MPQPIPPLIITPFAASGDQSVVPATDPNGFVNFASGYTPDYELNLASGDPQAKAVERGIQNYLFNALTTALQAWQNANRPPWYNTMPGGYSQYAEVVQLIGGVLKPFRSLASGNVTTPGASSTWEYIEGTGEMIQNIPMPAGGSNGPGSFLITAATNLNSLTNGSYQFQNNTIVTGSPNAPANGGNAAQAGMLEATTWNDGTNVYTSQFYRDKAGLGFMRGCTNGAWSNWKIWASANQFVVGEIRPWYGTATQAAVTAAWGAGWHLCDGTLGTPNLQGSFLLGAGASIAAGSAGGAGTVALGTSQLPVHNHVINIGDPGHAHSVADPGHIHGLGDPGHAHGVADPGHQHTFGGGAIAIAGGGGGFFLTNGGATATSVSGTGIGIYANGTGIYMGAAATGIGIYAAGTGINASSNNAGSGAAFSIIPPYVAVSYVMYTGA